MKIKKQFCLFFLLSFCLSAHAQWTIPNPDFGNNGRIDDIYFVTPDIGWAAYKHGIYKTTDGGQSWNEQFSNSILYFRSIEFLDENRGFAGTLDGVLLRTLDGGETWENITPITSPPLTGFCGIAHVGELVYSSGIWAGPAHIIKSEDIGGSWEIINMNSYADALVDIHFDTPEEGFVTGQDETGASTILQTTDGGETWQKRYSGLQSEYVWKIQRVTADTLVASIEQFGGGNGKMLASYDNGVNWVLKEIPTASPGLQGIGFVTGNHGWVGGKEQFISETFDGGETWEVLDIGTLINRFFIYSVDLVYASGYNFYKYEGATTSTIEREKITQDDGLHFSINPTGDRGQFEAQFELSYTDNVDLCLYSMDGRRVKRLFNGRLSAGMHTFKQNDNLPSGTYVLGLQINRGLFSEKVMVP